MSIFSTRELPRGLRSMVLRPEKSLLWNCIKRLRPIVDILVLGTLIFTLVQSITANRLTQESIALGHMPCLEFSEPTITFDENTHFFTFTCVLENKSDNPALHVKSIHIDCARLTELTDLVTRVTDETIIMPHSNQLISFSGSYTKDNIDYTKPLYDQILDGTMPLHLTVTYAGIYKEKSYKLFQRITMNKAQHRFDIIHTDITEIQ